MARAANILAFFSLICAVSPFQAFADEGLSAVRTWLLLLNNDLPPQVVEQIAGSDYDLVVIDNLDTQSVAGPKRMRDIVERLKRKPDGTRRIVIAYLNAGQAENYRNYWQNGWRPKTPDWILGEDPDGWEGNFPVAYWDKSWRDIFLHKSGLVDQMTQTGFDGVYLDWVGGFEDDRVVRAAQRTGLNAKSEMIDWIRELSVAAKDRSPGFLIIAQNASVLLRSEEFLSAIDAVAQEDIWFTGAAGGVEGDCPVPANDIELRAPHFERTLSNSCRKAFSRDKANAMHFAGESVLVPLLIEVSEKGKVVLTVDYALDPKNVEAVRRKSRDNGFVPFVGARSLKDFLPPK